MGPAVTEPAVRVTIFKPIQTEVRQIPKAARATFPAGEERAFLRLQARRRRA
jgi:hypothetical protein